MFAVSACYRLITLVLLLWLFSRWNDKEKRDVLDYQQRAYERAGILFLVLSLVGALGTISVVCHTVYKNKKEETEHNYFDAAVRFSSWYLTTLICGPIFPECPNTKVVNRFQVFQTYFRIDALAYFIFRSLVLLTFALLYEYNYLDIDERLCSSSVIKSYFPQICYYILVPIGLFHYLMIEFTFMFNSFLARYQILSILVDS